MHFTVWLKSLINLLGIVAKLLHLGEFPLFIYFFCGSFPEKGILGKKLNVLEDVIKLIRRQS